MIGMRSREFLLPAVVGSMVLCAMSTVTDSFGAPCEEHEGQAFWDCYARVSDEAVRTTPPMVFGATTTPDMCEGLPEKPFAACMRVVLKRILAGDYVPLEGTPAPHNAAGQGFFQQEFGGLPALEAQTRADTLG
jgi:hypothetical protein